MNCRRPDDDSSSSSDPAAAIPPVARRIKGVGAAALYECVAWEVKLFKSLHGGIDPGNKKGETLPLSLPKRPQH